MDDMRIDRHHLPEGFAGLGRGGLQQRADADFAVDLDLEAAEIVGDVVRDLELVVPPLIPHLALGNRIDRLVRHECLPSFWRLRAARR